MKIYHGNATPNWVINPYKKSRYGMFCLFFTPTPKLAEMYAIHEFKKSFGRSNGCLYEFEIDDNIPDVVFAGDTFPFDTYRKGDKRGFEFSDLVKQQHRLGRKAVRIRHCWDFPTKTKDRRRIKSDIICVFDPSVLSNQQLFNGNIRQYEFPR